MFPPWRVTESGEEMEGAWPECVSVFAEGASLCSLGDRVCLLKSSHLSSCPSSCLPVCLLCVFHSPPKPLTPPAFTPEVPRVDRMFLGSLGGCCVG